MKVSFEAFVIDNKRLATFEAKVEKLVLDGLLILFSTASRRPVSRAPQEVDVLAVLDL